MQKKIKFYERKLARMKVKRQILLDEKQSPDERTWQTTGMAKDSVGGQMLIGLLSENRLPAILLPVVEEHLFNNPDLSVRIQAGRYIKRPGTDKQFSIDAIAAMPGDAAAGKTVFMSNCSTCHKAGSMGNNIGPELTLIGKKFDRVALLDAIINPGAGIVFGYETWLVNTKDGESVFGFLVADNPQTVVLKDVSGNKHVIARKNISSKEKQTTSLMPDPATTALTAKDLADVSRFLLSLRQ